MCRHGNPSWHVRNFSLWQLFWREYIQAHGCGIAMKAWCCGRRAAFCLNGTLRFPPLFGRLMAGFPATQLRAQPKRFRSPTIPPDERTAASDIFHLRREGLLTPLPVASFSIRKFDMRLRTRRVDSVNGYWCVSHSIHPNSSLSPMFSSFVSLT